MAYEDPDKFISDSTLFFLPGAMILWLLIFMIVTLSYSVNSPPKIMPRAVNLGLVGVASVFMGLWLLGLMVCYCRGTFLKGRSGRDVAPKPPGWGEDMEKRMCQLEKQTKPPTPLPGQAQRNHQEEQIRQRDERLLRQSQPFQEQPVQQPIHPQSFQPLYSQGIPTQPQPLGQHQPLPQQQQPYPYPVQPEPMRQYKAFQPQAQQQNQQQAHQDGVRRHQSRPMPDGPRDMPPSQHRSRNRQPSPGRANRYPPLTSGYNSSVQNTPITMYHPPRSSSQPPRVRSTVQEVSESPGSPTRGKVSRRQGSDNLRRSRSSPPPGEVLQSGRHWDPAQDQTRPFVQNDDPFFASPDMATKMALTVKPLNINKQPSQRKAHVGSSRSNSRTRRQDEFNAPDTMVSMMPDALYRGDGYPPVSAPSSPPQVCQAAPSRQNMPAPDDVPVVRGIPQTSSTAQKTELSRNFSQMSFIKNVGDKNWMGRISWITNRDE